MLAVIAFGSTIIIGSAIFPILALPFYKQSKWRIGFILFYSSIALSVVIIPIINISQKTPEPNVSFHGIILDIDGKPTPNAEVTVSNCTEPKTFTSNEKGEFTINTFCQPNLFFNRIYDPITKSNCLLSWQLTPRSAHELMIFTSGEKDTNLPSRWKNYDTSNPFIFECIWKKPVLEGDAHYRIDNHKTYTLNFAHTEKPLGEEEQDGQLTLKIDVDESRYPFNTPRYAIVTIKPIIGGIQADRKYKRSIVAPKDSYIEHYSQKFEYQLYRPFGDEQFYFFSNNGAEYGHFKIHFNSWVHNKFSVDISYIVNMEGSRALTSLKK